MATLFLRPRTDLLPPSTENVSFRWEHIPQPEGAPKLADKFVGCKIGDKIFVFGGLDRNASARTPLKYVQIFNLSSNQWEPIVETTHYSRDVTFIYRQTAFEVEPNMIALVLSSGIQYFDTIKMDWIPERERPSSGSEDSETSIDLAGFNHHAMFDKTKIYRWDHRETLFKADVATGCVLDKPQSWGDVPFDQYEVHPFVVDDKVICIDASSNDSILRLCAYNPTDFQWRRIETINPCPPVSLCVGYTFSRFGPYLITVDANWTQPFKVSVLDLRTLIWTWLDALPGAPIHDGLAFPVFIAPNKLYWFGADKSADIHVLHVENLLSDSETAAFDAAFSQDLSSHFAQFKQEVPKTDEFVESDILEERDIITNAQLAPFSLSEFKIHGRIEQSLMGFFKGTSVVSPTIVSHNLPLKSDTDSTPPQGHVFHQNFISYLTIAYNAHFSVILTPDIVFYTLLAEFADELKKNPKKFEQLFTRTPGQKQKIITLSDDPAFLDLSAVVAALKEAIPSRADIFEAKFSTTTTESLLAMNAAFADAMSPYYDYFNTLCGIPRIRVLGTKTDWQQIESKLLEWEKTIGRVDKKLKMWISEARSTVVDIYTQRDPKFWSSMFAINRCSSGHTDLVEGWISRLYRCGHGRKYKGETTYMATDFYNFDTHVSTVTWTNLETSNKYGLYTGLLYSTYATQGSGGNPESLDAKFPFLEPHFAHLVLDASPRLLTPEEYDAYIEALPGDDGGFLEKHKQYLDAPVILEPGHQKLVQKREIVLKKWQKMLQWAQEGKLEPQKIAIDYFSTISISDRYDPQPDEKNLIDSISKAIVALIQHPGAVESLQLSTDTPFDPFLPQIIDAAASCSSLKEFHINDPSASLFDTDDAPLCKFFRSTKCGVEKLCARFHWDTEPSSFAKLCSSIKESPLALKSIEAVFPSYSIVEAILTRAYHEKSPLEGVSFLSARHSGDSEKLDVATLTVSELEKHLAQLKLKKLMLQPFNVVAADANGAEIEEINRKKRENGLALARIIRGLPHLESISNCFSGDETADKAVLEALVASKTLKSVVAASTDATVATIVRSLPMLERICSDRVDLGPLSCSAVAERLRSPDCKLIHVDFYKSQMSADDMGPIKAAMKDGFGSQLQFLKLNREEILPKYRY